MFLIPNWLVSLFSFPGVVIHEFSHEMFCRFFGIKVNKVVYFQFDSEIAGFVDHETPQKISQLFWISMGPIVGNTIISILLAHYSFFTASTLNIKIITAWLAFTIALHAFPSNTDARNILDEAKAIRKNGGSVFYYLAYPFFALIWTVNKLKFFWFDVVYAVLLFWIGFII
jgi:hypothetical protein